MKNVIIVDTVNKGIVKRLLKDVPEPFRPVVFCPGDETLLKGCKFNNIYVVDMIPNFEELFTTIIYPGMVDNLGSIYYRPDDITIENWLSGVSSNKRGY